MVPIVISNVISKNICILNQLPLGEIDKIDITPRVQSEDSLVIHRSRDHFSGVALPINPPHTLENAHRTQYTSQHLWALCPKKTHLKRYIRKILFQNRIWKPRSKATVVECNPDVLNTSVISSESVSSPPSKENYSKGIYIPVRITNRKYVENTRVSSKQNLCFIPYLGIIKPFTPLRFGQMNAQSCRKKTAIIRDYMNENDLDILVITE